MGGVCEPLQPPDRGLRGGAGVGGGQMWRRGLLADPALERGGGAGRGGARPGPYVGTRTFSVAPSAHASPAPSPSAAEEKSTSSILDDIGSMFDDLADQLDAMLE